MELKAITLDCADPLALATFYHRATGMRFDDRSNEEFAAVGHDSGVVIGFQRVVDYRAPRWPGQQVPQQMHFDFEVTDLDRAETDLLALGATQPSTQPGGTRWRVLLDPAGHPFCLTAARHT